MIKGLKIFNTADAAALHLAEELCNSVNSSTGNYYIAVSGGNSPLVLFNRLASPEFSSKIEWGRAHFFWCDERCVAPEDSQSNFGAADKALLKQVAIPAANIHRIHGEDNPNEEAIRYSNEIEKFVPPGSSQLPRFDHILLGLGEDGHTASLFPGKNLLFVYSNIAGVAKHPVTGQNRISLTSDVIKAAKKISFFVTSKSKAKVVSEIINDLPAAAKYPAAEISALKDNIEWIMDKEAAFYL